MIALFLLLAFAPSWATAAQAPAPRKFTTLSVDASGSLPGFSTVEARQYLAQEMAKGAGAGWTFTPAPQGGSPAPDRIEWRFRLDPYAGGGIRQIIPIPSVKRLFGTHHLISVEARLYLDGEYETMTFGEATVSGGGQDAELAGLIDRLTRNILAEATAFHAVGSSP
jgi:hypothetical protein